MPLERSGKNTSYSCPTCWFFYDLTHFYSPKTREKSWKNAKLAVFLTSNKNYMSYVKISNAITKNGKNTNFLCITLLFFGNWPIFIALKHVKNREKMQNRRFFSFLTKTAGARLKVPTSLQRTKKKNTIFLCITLLFFDNWLIFIEHVNKTREKSWKKQIDDFYDFKQKLRELG